MIPSSLTAARGFVLRKIAGRYDACRQLASGGGACLVRHPSLLGTVGAFVLMILPVLAVLAIVAVALHDMTSAVSGVGALKAMSLLTAKKLREDRAVKATEANDILVRSTAGLTAEDQVKFDAIHADIEKLGKQIESVERHEKLMAEQATSSGVVAGKQDAGVVSADERKAHADKADAAFSAWMRGGVEALDAEQRSIMQGRFTRDGVEQRAPQTVTTTGGGYLIPTGFSGKLEESMKMYGGVEQAGDVFPTDSGNPLPYPTVDDTAVSGAMLAINTQIAEQIIGYGVVNFAAYKMTSKLVLVPVELMQDSAFDIDSHVASVLGTRLGRIHNSYQTTGTGSSEPGGIQTGGSSGLTAAGATTITFDELTQLEHSVDPAYRLPAFGAGYMFNDGSLLKLKQVKDGEGRPLWQAGVGVGAPNTINGFPYHINQDMPAMTTGLKPVLFGALKKFKIRKVKDITVLRLVERYADYHQIGFVAFTRFDSKVLDAGTDPIKYITMA